MAVNVEEVKFQITAQDQATRVFKSLQGAVGSLQSSYVALGAAVAGGAVLTGFLSNAIAVRSALDDLADTTGDNVKTLDGLRRIANVAGVDMDRLGGALTKLAKNMNSADDDGKAAGEAIKAIGLDIEGLRAKKPGEAMFEIAMALSKFEDGAAKVAVAMALMGKEGAKMLPLLKDMAEEGQLNGRITNEQAAAAEALEKSYRRLNQSFIDGKDSLATQLIPSLTSLLQEMTEGIRITGSLTNALMTLGTINPFRSIRGNIESLQADIDSRNAQRAAMAGKTFGSGAARYTGAISDIDAANAADQKRLEFLKFQQRQEALSLSSGDSPGERARMGASRAQLDFKIPDKEKKGKPPENAFDSLLRQYEEMVARGRELSQVEQAIGLFQTARYEEARRANPELARDREAQILALAAQFDATERLRKAEKEETDKRKERDRENERAMMEYARHLETLAAKYKDLADPLEKYRKELKDIIELQEMGYLTAEQALEAAFVVQNRMEDEFNKVGKSVSDTTDLAKELGLTFSSAFEDAIVGGKKFSDVLRSLAQDVLKMFVRDQLTKPLANAAGNLFKSVDWGSLFSFKAEGGPVSANTPYIVGEKGPELFMPSASGNIVPNSKLATGGGVTIVQNMSFGSDVSRATLQQWGEQVKRDTVLAVADARMRGGAYSGAMGR